MIIMRIRVGKLGQEVLACTCLEGHKGQANPPLLRVIGHVIGRSGFTAFGRAYSYSLLGERVGAAAGLLFGVEIVESVFKSVCAL